MLLIDDREARRAASSFTITVTGTAAVVGAAKQAGLIASARTIFDQLRLSGFRISDEIMGGILESVGEGEPVAKPVRETRRRRGQQRGRKGRSKNPM